MKLSPSYTPVLRRDDETGLLMAYVPGWPGTIAYGATIAELQEALQTMIRALLDAEGDRMGWAAPSFSSPAS